MRDDAFIEITTMCDNVQDELLTDGTFLPERGYR